MLAESAFRIYRINNLVHLAQSDGKIDVAELEYLHEKKIELGIDSEFFNELLKNPNSLWLKIPNDHHHRQVCLIDALEISLVDGEFAKEEFDICLKVAESLGFDRDSFCLILKLCLGTDKLLTFLKKNELERYIYFSQVKQII